MPLRGAVRARLVHVDEAYRGINQHQIAWRAISVDLLH